MNKLVNYKNFLSFFAILSIFFNIIPSYSQDEDSITMEIARKIAQYQCISFYGDFSIFDEVIYFDSDDTPAIFVFVFKKTDRFNSISELKNHITLKYSEVVEATNIIKNNGFGNRQKLLEARSQLKEAYDEINLEDDFISIYVSAVMSHSPVPQEKNGLPESYTHLPGCLEHYKSLTGMNAEEYKFYYLGFTSIFFSGINDGIIKIFNILDSNQEIGIDNLKKTSFKNPSYSLKKEAENRIRKKWDYFLKVIKSDKLESKLLKYGLIDRETEDVTLDNVPDFYQSEFYNILPAGRSCAVMSAGSMFGYYDHQGYWNLVDFTKHGGTTNNPKISPHGGFDDEESGYAGVDSMILNLANAMNYDKISGGVTVDLLNDNIKSGIKKFANNSEYGNNLNFSVNADIFLPCGYSTIKNHIDAGRPVILAVDQYSLHDDPGPGDVDLPFQKSHNVIVVGYNTEMGENYSEGIYVYTNAGTGLIKWDYDDIGRKFTWKIEPGGDPGTDLSPPILNSPSNKSFVEIRRPTLEWNDVIGAKKYRLWIANNQDFNNKNEYWPTNTSYPITSDLADGTYYWKVVPMNEKDNWCSFSETYSFKIDFSPTYYLSISDLNWDDDDDDGVVEAGEKVRLRIKLHSTSNVENVKAVLYSDDSSINITSPNTYFYHINSGDTEWSVDWLNIILNYNNEKTVDFTLHVTYEKDGYPYSQDFPITKHFKLDKDWGDFVLVSFTIDDSKDIYSLNNEDGIFQSGEEIALRPRIKNNGEVASTGIDVSLLYEGNNLQVEEGDERYPDLKPGESAYPKDGRYFWVYAERNFADAELIGLNIVCEENKESKEIPNALQITVEPEAWMNLSLEKHTESYNKWNFGTVLTGVDITNTLIISNGGSKVMQISAITPSPTDNIVISDDGLPWTINPGESKRVDITIKTTEPGEIKRIITVKSNGRARKDSTLTITGIVSDAVPTYKIPNLTTGRYPDIYGNIIVWQDSRNGNADIYAYNLQTEQEIPICTNPADQLEPKISGNLIAWSDRRNWNGTGDISNDIYAYDMATGKEFAVSTDPGDEQLIGVDEGKILFTRNYYTFTERSNYGSDLCNLFLYDHITKLRENITKFESNENHNPMKTIDNDGDFNNNLFVGKEYEVHWVTEYIIDRWEIKDCHIVYMKMGVDKELHHLYDYKYSDYPTTNGNKIAWEDNDEIVIWENGVITELIASNDIDYSNPVLGDNYIVYFTLFNAQWKLICRDLVSGEESLISSEAVYISDEQKRMYGDNLVWRRHDTNEIGYAFLGEPLPPLKEPDIALLKIPVEIDSVTVGEKDYGTFTIINEGDADLIIYSITSNDSNFTLSPESGTIAPDKSLIVTITFTPIVAGADSTKITITSNDGDVAVNAKGIGVPIESHCNLYASNTGNNSTIMILNTATPTMEGNDIANGDEIGIFTPGGLCMGFGVWDGNNLAITVWGDDPDEPGINGFQTGEEYNFKIWDASAEKEYNTTATYESGSSNYSTNGISIVSKLGAVVISELEISLPFGWSIISSNVIPDNPGLDDVMLEVKDNVKIIKNGNGQVYWSEYNVNQIGNWSITDGYQIKMKSSDTLKISGNPVDVSLTTLNLIQAWNLISYLPSSSMSCESAFSSIVNKIIIAKNNAGQVYWPQYSTNQIGDLNIGEGYWIKVSEAVDFTYPTSSSKIAMSKEVVISSTDDETADPVYFVFTSNTGNNATIMIPADINPNIIGETLENGDEIGVFTPSGLCCGAGVCDGNNLAITVWGDDPDEPGINGFQTGEEYNFKIWDASTNIEYDSVATSDGDLTYSVNGITALSSLTASPSNKNKTIERTINSNTGTVGVKFEDNSQLKLKFNSGEVSGKTVNITGLGSTLSGETDPNKKSIEGSTVVFYNIETDITGEFEAELEVTFTDSNLSVANLTLDDTLVLAYYRTDISKWWRVPTVIYKERMIAKAVVSHFSIWALVDSTDPNVVPVELSSFTAEIDINDRVVLEWITLSETNNYGFYIERSIDNINFKVIEFVKGMGNSSNDNIYSFIDTDSREAGTYYYRLKQVDFDGSYEYSDILEVEVLAPKEFKLEQNYPNPFNPETKIEYEIPKTTNVVLKIYNILGQEIKTLIYYEQQPGNYQIIWDGTNNNNVRVSSGVYIYQIRASNFIQSKKMIFLR